MNGSRTNWSFIALKRCCALWLLASWPVMAAESALDWRAIESKWEEWMNLPEAAVREKAEAGDPVAKYFYWQKAVKEQPADQTRWVRARKFLEEASAAGEPHAMQRFALEFRDKDNAKYIGLLEKAAKVGLPSAQLELAGEMLEGERADVDEEKAVDWVRNAADSGYRNAQFELAEMYACGLGEPRHSQETPFQLYLRAATAGYKPARAKVAQRYLTGFGAEINHMEAARWYWRVWQQSEEPPRVFLDKDYNPIPSANANIDRFSRFFSLYAKANLNHDPETMFKVGKAFARGEFGRTNSATGFLWLKRAELEGHAEARTLAAKTKETLTAAEIASVEKDLAILRNPQSRRQP